MRFTRKRRAVASRLGVSGGALALLLLVGCGGGPAPSNSGAGTGSCGPGTAVVSGIGTPTVAVVATDQLKFSPAIASVHVGQVVEWTVNGTMIHTITFLSANAACLSDPQLEPGSSWEVKFTQAGTYDYKCTIHPGMKGTVTVSP